MPDYVLHLSDLHFGADHGFLMPGQQISPGEIESDIADAIANDLLHQKIAGIAGVVVSGDIMTYAKWVDHAKSAFDVLRKLCGLIGVSHDNVFFVPGNHDYEWYEEKEAGKITRKLLADARAPEAGLQFGHVVQFNNFVTQFREKAPFDIPSVHSLQLSNYVLRLGLIDSCRITSTKFHDYGYVSLGQMKDLFGKLRKIEHGVEVRAVVLHHHVLSIIPAEPPKDEASVSVTLDASRLIEHSLASGVSFFLHGHQHYPCVSRVNKSIIGANGADGLAANDVYVLSSGSASVKRTRMSPHVSNTYSIIEFKAEEAIVTIRKIYSDGAEGGTLLQANVPLQLHRRA